MSGKRLLSYELLPERNKLVLQEQGLENGLYFYRVMASGVSVATGKLVIIQ